MVCHPPHICLYAYMQRVYALQMRTLFVMWVMCIIAGQFVRWESFTNYIIVMYNFLSSTHLPSFNHPVVPLTTSILFS